MTDSSTVAVHRHVVFMTLCGTSLLMSNSPWFSQLLQTNKQISFWLSRYQLPNLRRNKERRRRSRDAGEERSLLQLIQEGSGVCCSNASSEYWGFFWRRVRRRCGGNGGVCISECGGMFYIARSEVQRERERVGGVDGKGQREKRWNEEGGGREETGGEEKEVHTSEKQLLTSSRADI